MDPNGWSFREELSRDDDFFASYPIIRTWLRGGAVRAHTLLCEARTMLAELEERLGDITAEEGPCSGA